ncbi:MULTISPECIES: MarR family winged helix-turn-helix transcriptional regulator [unclassified Enterococcus]|uniref:MarR family winged helix-turn-helix transcriptional regulator n=1 Tax=unclassified Enterococcus TaxID=2608891 RepID=UPI001556DC13|nr:MULTISPECIES: MarR family winged helix-turn-helix transcriptional regulator [unclassified Enterococcus]MBS7577795.1 winged helix-turn-helix transcriptional regulator [Enterococcus sp. MMGLQ5-2]MBS7585055.1 winged helix-turn-helix transcriptional regulator [Enterococcus sp. MMGLQ5-1]NPD12911.1 winged helix-turn-helix transcriptional regulator [Enterococcus sp. MMGLQ5-1]NPD37625.1 winged helix-turn-helix transcriptional regulator [Enterococcus sp. MMGLQ5-2]
MANLELLDLLSQLTENSKIKYATGKEKWFNSLMDRAAVTMLKTVFDHEGATNSELSNILDIRPSSVSNSIKTLERLNLICRVVQDYDKRIIKIYTTDRGKKEIIQMGSIPSNLAKKIFDFLDNQEKKQLERILSKLLTNIEKEDFSMYENYIDKNIK